MFDSAELAKVIAANPGDLEAALLAYEKDLFPRSASEAVEAEKTVEQLIGPNAPQSLVGMFTHYQSVN